MTDFARPKFLAAGVLLPALLLGAGCQERVAGVAATRVYAIDQNGRAKTCNAPAADTSAGKPTDATITMSNEGGWCGVTTRQGNRPYSAGLIQTRPQHGMAFVHTVGDDTRVDFTPDAGFTGQDKFSVRLIPGNAILNVAVTVTPR
jgi:hypothetical protein